MNDTLGVVLVELLSGNQTGRDKPRVLSQSVQELSISSLLKSQLLMSIHKLRILQDFSMLTAFSRRSFRTCDDQSVQVNPLLLGNPCCAVQLFSCLQYVCIQPLNKLLF